MTTQNETNWEDEFREYFDKALKPKKPTLINLDRELCIDFIKKQLALLKSRQVEAMEKKRKPGYGWATSKFNQGIDTAITIINTIK